MFLSILLALFLLMVVLLMIMPIVLFIDTDRHEYYIKIKGLIKLSIEGYKDEVLRINLKILFFHFYYYPLREIGKSTPEKKRKKRVNKSSRRISMRKGLRLIRSFKIKQLYLDVDTGDVVKNAQLYPYFAFLNYRLGTFHINFEGRNRMALCIRNRPINIIRSFINF